MCEKEDATGHMQEMQSLSSKETTLFEHSKMFLEAGGHMTNWILLHNLFGSSADVYKSPPVNLR